MPGTLFVVATPIGNLEDLTFRALRILREADVIAAEDTRRTAKLLSHYEIRTPMVSLHEHNEQRTAPALIERLTRGETVALVSDAGTPGISDPGQILVRLARNAGATITPVPGPSAITAALSVSGLDLSHGFVFAGFPPATGSARQAWFDNLPDEPRAVVLFEAPHRIKRTLDELRSKLVTRQIYCIREITKIHEQLVVWNSSDLADSAFRDLGEFVVIVSPSETPTKTLVNESYVLHMFGLLTNVVGLDDEAAVAAVAGALAMTTKDVRKAMKKARIAADRAQTGAS